MCLLRPGSSQPSPAQRPRSGPLIISILFLMTLSAVLAHATEFKLTGTPSGGKNVVLTVNAKIMRIARESGVESYTLWRNGQPFVTVKPRKLEEKNGLKGVLPPGNYVLRTTGGSVTLYLDTVYKPEKISLWGRRNALVEPLADGNEIVLASPAMIVSSFYDGTVGMGIYFETTRVLYFVSPHNRTNPGPRVIGGTGGKTLVGQVLPAGVYHLNPERGVADGIVRGDVVLDVR